MNKTAAITQAALYLLAATSMTLKTLSALALCIHVWDMLVHDSCTFLFWLNESLWHSKWWQYTTDSYLKTTDIQFRWYTIIHPNNYQTYIWPKSYEKATKCFHNPHMLLINVYTDADRWHKTGSQNQSNTRSVIGSNCSNNAIMVLVHCTDQRRQLKTYFFWRDVLRALEIFW